MTHSLKNAYDRAIRNRPPPKEPPITYSHMTREEMDKYLKGMRA